MFLLGFPAAAFATNCFVVAPAEGEECLIIDPGVGVIDRLGEVLRAHRLRPAAVLLTHGHLDHTFSVTPVCGAHQVAAHIHHDDAYRLENPVDQLGEELRAMLVAQFGSALAWKEPDDVVTFADSANLHLGGLDVHVRHAPGHTEGSVIFSVEDIPSALPADSGLTRTVFAGDVLFAGGIGRTDLPGGDDAAMTRSLRDVILTEADDSIVFPGHGPATTIARERATNPYLQHLR
ncbi:MBL fold metallo-hydrolase [Gephyromycinifex aptenodytis]|uniref:MBL fold metallo-hydrolase n=1 Tax=Gephyromycinifex aptenodytis TaxID=2716227 RepID=UPI001447D410|nr:MBL fold metallo-hydrolase [Gephyromycinifex aptenodytis]